MRQRMLDLIGKIGRGRDFILVAEKLAELRGIALLLQGFWSAIGFQRLEHTDRPFAIAGGVAVTDKGGVGLRLNEHLSTQR